MGLATEVALHQENGQRTKASVLGDGFSPGTFRWRCGTLLPGAEVGREVRGGSIASVRSGIHRAVALRSSCRVELGIRSARCGGPLRRMCKLQKGRQTLEHGVLGLRSAGAHLLMSV